MNANKRGCYDYGTAAGKAMCIDQFFHTLLPQSFLLWLRYLWFGCLSQVKRVASAPHLPALQVRLNSQGKA